MSWVSVSLVIGLAPSGREPAGIAGFYDPEPRDQSGAEPRQSDAALFGVLAFVEGAVGDALEEFGVVAERSDVAPVDRLGIGIEVIVAEMPAGGRASRRSRPSCS